MFGDIGADILAATLAITRSVSAEEVWTVFVAIVTGDTEALLLTARTSSAAPEHRTTAPESAPPEDVVREFYQAWISAEGNPINQRSDDNTDYLTPDFIQRSDDRILEQGGIATDPLVYAQNRPSQIEVGEATITGDTARVSVQTIWAHGPDTNATHELQGELARPVKDWRSDDVRYAADQ